MAISDEAYDTIGFQLKKNTKEQFKKLCKERGSNMSVELKRFIHNQIEKEKE